MQQGVTVLDLGTILGIWAHPDDEAYLSAALMAEARDAGQSVVVATATDGGLGGDGPVADQRRLEVVESLAAVGVADHRWLGFRDGECADVPSAVADRAIRALIEEVRPDTVVTFGSDGLTGHPDHVAVSGWVERAWRADGCRALPDREQGRGLQGLIGSDVSSRFDYVMVDYDGRRLGLPPA